MAGYLTKPIAFLNVAEGNIAQRLALLVAIALAGTMAGSKALGLAADHLNYFYLYYSAAATPWAWILLDTDPLYHGLSKFISSFGLTFDGFTLILALLTCAFKFSALSQVPKANRIVLFSLYFSYLFWVHEYIQIRIAFSMALGLFALYGTDKFKYPLFMCAVLIHNTFLLVVGLYFLFSLGLRRPIAAAVIGGTFLAIAATQGLINDLLSRAQQYQDLLIQGQFTAINITSLMPIIMALSTCAAIYHIKMIPKNERQELYFTIVSFSSFYVLSATPVFAFRTMELLMPFYLILIARMWHIGIIFKLSAALYVLVGLRLVFFADDPLIGNRMLT